ncbi:radical SAM protein [Candidatus Parcubacteria bacterium]|nr:MAG: radical SAM protein [Candidatus Parcubacteria bacterium]
MKKVNSFIERKTLLYKTGVEYGDYTINHVQGCSHGCKYPCYAFLMAKRFSKVKTYEEWIEPKLVCNTIELLRKEIPRYKDKITSVHLCFTTDPFMYEYDEISASSIEIIRELNNAGIKCTALTKGLLPLELAEFPLENEFGITLISLNEDFRKKIEPFAASYEDRINSLYELHKKGCRTWVSIEPYPTPNIIEQDIQGILEAVSFADRIIFGRTNYNSLISQYPNFREFYNQLSLQVIDFCEMNRIDCHIKEGTLTIKHEDAVTAQALT